MLICNAVGHEVAQHPARRLAVLAVRLFQSGVKPDGAVDTGANWVPEPLAIAANRALLVPRLPRTSEPRIPLCAGISWNLHHMGHLLAMQKVLGSNPISRLQEGLQIAGFWSPPVG